MTSHEKPQMAMKIESQEVAQAMHIESTNNQERPIGSHDVAMQLVDNYVRQSITPQQDRACLRRIDLVFMPVMFLSFAVQYLDKACLTGAALLGIVEDLDLVKMYVINAITSHHNF